MISPCACFMEVCTLAAELIMATLRGDGSVLIPVDAAGRMLEVALLLEEFWGQEQ